MSHRRPRRWSVGKVAGAAVAVPIAVLAFASLGRSHAHPATGAPIPTGPRPTVAAATATPPTPTPEAFARSRGLALFLPTPTPAGVLYHQASYHDAWTIHPLGHLSRNANRSMFDPPRDGPGPDYIVMSSRGRGTPATSAVDVVLPSGSPVAAPVSGRVTKAKPYVLYGRYRDWRVEILPTGRPDVRVVIIHLAEVQVRRGDRVSATLSVVGYPREFPFRSQVDDYLTGGDPHVHIEVTKPPSKAAS